MSRIVQLLALAIAARAARRSAASSASSDMVVSQVFAGGGNTNAPYTNDFVELFDRGSGTRRPQHVVDPVRHGVGHDVANNAPVGICPGGRSLLDPARFGGGDRRLVADSRRDRDQQSRRSGGRSRLSHSTTGLTCGASAGSCSADPSVVDMIGYGSATDFEGGEPAAGHQQHDRGRPCRRWMYGNRRERDRTSPAAAPTPRNSAAVAAPCSGRRLRRAKCRRTPGLTSISSRCFPSPSSGRASASGMPRPARRRRRSRSASPSRVITRPGTRSLSIARPLSRLTSRLVSRQRRRAAARSAAA